MTITESTAQATILTQTPNDNFFSSGTRAKVDRWMDVLWSGGVNNPMDSIEQLSYLLFLRLLSERDDQYGALDTSYTPVFSGEWSRYAWANFVTLTGDELFDTLRSVIERLHELPGLTPTGKELFRNATLKIYDRSTLRTVVQSIDTVDLVGRDGRDLKGDIYEYLLGKLSQSGTNGQFRTPRHIVNLIVQLVNPQPGERIIDPACGTGGFLVSAYNHIVRQHTHPADLARGDVDGSMLSTTQWNFLDRHAFTGYDNDANMVKLAIMNLYLHQLEQSQVRHFNPLTTKTGDGYPGQRYDVVLANPPFAGKIETESILADINLTSRNTELLFMKWFLDHLAPSARAGVIVPEGVIVGNDSASTRIRHTLLESFNLEAVVSLPHFAFKPYASVATFILIFSAAEPTDRTWMYQLTQDGFTGDGVRTPHSQNDLPDLVNLWSKRNEAAYSNTRGKHGWVTKEEIVSQGFSLAPRVYLSQNQVGHGYPTESIDSLCKRGVLLLQKGKASANRETPGIYPMVTTAEDLKTTATYHFDGPGICIPLVSSTGHGHASIKRIAYLDGKFAAASIVAVLQVLDKSVLLPRFVFFYLEALRDDVLVPLMRGAANVSLTLGRIGTVELPLPSIEQHESIIEELELTEAEMLRLRRTLTATAAVRVKQLSELGNHFMPHAD